MIESLEDEVVAIAVDDEGRQAVGFGVDQAVGVGVADRAGAEVDGGFEAAGVELGIRFGGIGREHAQGDLGGGAEVGHAEGTRSTRDADQSAGLRTIEFGDIALEDPGVARIHTGRGFAVDANGLHA